MTAGLFFPLDTWYIIVLLKLKKGDRMAGIFKQIDMTEGPVGSQIISFTIPMLLGNIAQQLYNTADSVIVGRFIGDNALAAVGSAGPIMNIFFVLIIGISVGAGIMVSQHFGARDREGLSWSVGGCITLVIIASLFLMIVMPLVSLPLLRLLNTPESIIGWCNSYLRIIFYGVLGNALYNILSGVLRGLGDSTSALYYLLAATFTNIVLDYVFVGIVGMGVPGAALATIMAQGFSALLCLRKLSQMSHLFDLKLSYMRPNRQYMTRLIRLGLPSGITQAIFAMSSILVQSLSNTFGEQFIAANVIVMRIDGFVMMPVFSFGNTMTTFAGQNVGAGNYSRVYEGARKGTLISLGVSSVMLAAILLFGRTIMGIFTTTESLITLSANIMRLLALGYLAMSVTQCLSGTMRGSGNTVAPMWISIITTVFIRVPLAYAISFATRTPALPHGTFWCIHSSMLASWLTGALITTLLYKTGKWKKGTVLEDIHA